MTKYEEGDTIGSANDLSKAKKYGPIPDEFKVFVNAEITGASSDNWFSCKMLFQNYNNSEYKTKGYDNEVYKEQIKSCTSIINDKAESAINRSIAYYERAEVFRTLGNRQAAIADFSETLKLNPNHIRALYDRGIVKNEIGDNEGGARDLATARQLDPDIGDEDHRFD